jgi:hypothetical protein
VTYAGEELGILSLFFRVGIRRSVEPSPKINFRMGDDSFPIRPKRLESGRQEFRIPAFEDALLIHKREA